MIPLIIQDQFYTIQNLQRSPILQTSNWSGTLLAVSYSKLTLVEIMLVVKEYLYVVVRDDEQGSEYHGILPNSETLLTLKVKMEVV